MPIPEPTGQDARIEDLEIIATGDYNKIVARKNELVTKQAEIKNKESKEYKDLTTRINTLDAAAKKAKKDKGSKKSDDDLASWSGRVANASTNAFSASVTGVSVGVTGVSFSGTILSTWLTGLNFGAGGVTKSAWINSDLTAAIDARISAVWNDAVATAQTVRANNSSGHAAYRGALALCNIAATLQAHV